MIYTAAMKRDVHSLKPPHDFTIDIVEYDMKPPFLSIRFYESQWVYYSETERLKCLEYIQKVREILTGYGVPVTLEPVIDTGESLPEKYRR